MAPSKSLAVILASAAASSPCSSLVLTPASAPAGPVAPGGERELDRRVRCADGADGHLADRGLEARRRRRELPVAGAQADDREAALVVGRRGERRRRRRGVLGHDGGALERLALVVLHQPADAARSGPPREVRRAARPPGPRATASDFHASSCLSWKSGKPSKYMLAARAWPFLRAAPLAGRPS